jgi:ubiquinone/menaquinone biosynthesis C-methylase UbiE
MATNRPNYGLDAPGVVRNLVLAGVAGLLIGSARLAGLWSDQLVLAPFLHAGMWAGLTCLLMAGWMVWFSKVGKLRARERLLDTIAWRGEETVLDVGCGRGLLLIGAAKRLTTGKAIGVDIWQSEDLSGNRPEATRANAQLEGVGERVEVRDGDARQLPFPDNTFDVVVSHTVLHNIYNVAERRRAVSEIARVLKPRGCLVIADIRHTRDYVQVLRDHGWTEVKLTGSLLRAVLLPIITFGSIRPNEVQGTKPLPPQGRHASGLRA